MGQVDNCPNTDIPGLCVQRPQEVLSVCGADGGCAVEDSGFAETEGRVYRVRGRFGRENGAYSTIAKLAPAVVLSEMPDDWTEDLTPGREPSGLRATATSAGIELAWDRPREDFLSVDGYQVLRRDAYGPAFAPVMWNTRNSNRSWTDREVDGVVRYVYQVKAVRFKELSGASNEAEATALSSQPQQGTATPSAAGELLGHGVGRVADRSVVDVARRRANRLRSGVVSGRFDRLADGESGPRRDGHPVQSHRADGEHRVLLPGAGRERRRSGRMVISCGDHTAGAQQSGHRSAQHRRHGPGG